jgi:hypothetical protein
MEDNHSPSTERDLGRVEGKLDLLLAHFTRFDDDHKAHRAANDDRHAKLEARVTKIETRHGYLWVGLAAGAAAYLGDAKSFVLTLAKALF